MEGRNDAETSADRCLAEAVAQWQIGEFGTAAALFRATARYIERIDKESGPSKVVAFPLERMERSARLEIEGAPLPRAEVGS